jgi:hypothetical protein
MTKTHFSLAAAATVVLSSTFLFAQSAPTDAAPAPAGQVTKPSPYQGVSVPPANDSITTSAHAATRRCPASIQQS